VKAVVVASTSDDYKVGDKLRRGQTIQTDENEFLALQIGAARVGLAEKTLIELKRLLENERILIFPRGRIVVDNPEGAPLFINTLKTENTLTQGKATLINFDFLHTVHIIPLERAIQTRIIGTNEFLVLPRPIAVDESGTGSYQAIEFNPAQNTESAFYAWFDETASVE
jgi:hypothetical protein